MDYDLEWLRCQCDVVNELIDEMFPERRWRLDELVRCLVQIGVCFFGWSWSLKVFVFW